MSIQAGQIWKCYGAIIEVEILEIMENGLVKVTQKDAETKELLSEGVFEKADVEKYLTEYKFELQEVAV